jgi:hypothetical protein
LNAKGKRKKWKRSQAVGQPNDRPALEFPDWSGMQPHSSRMTFEEAVRWNDELLSLFPPAKKSAEFESERRCYVEFVL